LTAHVRTGDNGTRDIGRDMGGMNDDGSRRPGRERRQRMLAAATRLFIERGFDGTSVDEIIQAVGGSKTTLYSAFGNKQGLFAAVVADVTTRLDAAITLDNPADGSRRPPAEILAAAGTAAMRIVLSEEVMGLYRLAVAEAKRYPDLASSFWEKGPSSARAGLAAYLADAAAHGELRVEDPLEAAEMFLGMLLDRGTLALSLGVQEPPTNAAIDRRVAAATKVFMAAYGRDG
jgi:AcrR family transcriptional regulator